MKRIVLYLFSFSLFSFCFSFAYGEVMTGNVYKMDFDSINFAGTLSTTSEFYLEDSIGEVATGYSSSTIYSLHAGFLQKDQSTISISISSASVEMSPALGGLSGGYSNGQVSVSVTTDNIAGYALYIKASTSPALHSSNDSFADYVPTGAYPDYEFSTAVNTSNFGFSPEGTDIVSSFRDSGGACGTGSDTADKCWDGFSTADKIIASGSSRNDPSGMTTVMKFRAGVGSNRMQKPGNYYATTTVTAVSL